MTWLLERLALQPDVTRALRAASAFSVLLFICQWGGQPRAIQFAATTALAVSLPELRGAYHLRVALLLFMTSVFTGAAFWGALSAGNIAAAVLGIGILAVLSGFWRHLSADYGPAVGIDSALLFLIALEGPGHGATPGEIANWAALGGAGAIVLHLAVWLFRPQHALRHGVAETWVAVSNLFLAMRTETPTSLLVPRRSLREALDRSISMVAAARGRRNQRFMAHLDEMRHEAGRFSMQVSAFHTECETLIRQPEFANVTSGIDSLLTELGNLARSVAITLITHRPENFERTVVRLQTCKYLIEVLDQQLSSLGRDESEYGAARSLLRVMAAELPAIRSTLAETVDHSVHGATFPFHLPDLTDRSLRSIAAGFNPAPSFDPLIARYALRMALLSMFAVAIYQVFAIPRGYWMAFALIVVLQPHFGATRERAAQRVGGTLAGALCGSALLFTPLPLWTLGVLTSLTAFGFVYFLRRDYRAAVFFVTVMLVLVTELHVPVHMDFTIGRLLSNLAGAGLAFLAALYFWPRWERSQFPTLLAKAIRANCDYFDAVMGQPGATEGLDPEVVRCKQVAERAGNTAAASLQRMQSEPPKERENVQRATGAVTCNERVTSAIAVLATHFATEEWPTDSCALAKAGEVRAKLERAALVAEREDATDLSKVPLCDRTPTADAAHSSIVFHALDKLLTEVRALVAALRT